MSQINVINLIDEKTKAFESLEVIRARLGKNKKG